MDKLLQDMKAHIPVVISGIGIGFLAAMVILLVLWLADVISIGTIKEGFYIIVTDKDDNKKRTDALVKKMTEEEKKYSDEDRKKSLAE